MMGVTSLSVFAPAEVAIPAHQAPGATGYTVGAYYFPGWTLGNDCGDHVRPWGWLANGQNERIPLNGIYDERSVSVMTRQIEQAASYGIDYFCFDFYYPFHPATTQPDVHAIENFIASPSNSKMKFTLIHCMRGDAANPLDNAQSDALLDLWARWMAHPQWLRIDGKPVLFWLFHGLRFFGQSTTAASMASIKSGLAARGVPAIFNVAHAYTADIATINGYGAGIFDAVSCYNWISAQSNYAAMTAAYPVNLAGLVSSGWGGEIVVPALAGWSTLPWRAKQGTAGTMSDWCLPPAAADFSTHLNALKTYMTSTNPAQTAKKLVVVCAWNEFGEGSFIEPSRRYGFGMLDAIRATFK